MKRKPILFAGVALTAVILAFSAFTIFGNPALTGIGFAPGTETLTLKAGEGAQLEIHYTFDRDLSAEQQARAISKLTPVYTSADENIATVDENGNLKAITGGKTTITVVAGDGIAAQCAVSVTVPVETVTAIDALTLELNGENSGNVNAKVTPANAASAVICYESSNPEVATVDADGKVTAVALGECVITGTADGKSAKTEINVIAISERIELKSAEGWLYTGGSMTLNPVLFPEESAQGFTVESDNPEIATATKNEDGSITVSAISTGTAAITVQAGEVSATYTLTVRARPAQTPAAPGGGTPTPHADGGTPANPPAQPPATPPASPPAGPPVIDDPPLTPGDGTGDGQAGGM